MAHLIAFFKCEAVSRPTCCSVGLSAVLGLRRVHLQARTCRVSKCDQEPHFTVEFVQATSHIYWHSIEKIITHSPARIKSINKNLMCKLVGNVEKWMCSEIAKSVSKWTRKGRITKGVRIVHWNNCVFLFFFCFHWQLEINRAFSGTKLAFLCINCEYGLFIRLFSS